MNSKEQTQRENATTPCRLAISHRSIVTMNDDDPRSHFMVQSSQYWLGPQIWELPNLSDSGLAVGLCGLTLLARSVEG